MNEITLNNLIVGPSTWAFFFSLVVNVHLGNEHYMVFRVVKDKS